MKLRTQISLGYLGLVLIVMVSAIYFIFEMNRLDRINQSLTSVDFQARRQEIEEKGMLDDIFDYDLKYLATSDPDYLKGMRNRQADYESNFSSLTRLLEDPVEKQRADQIGVTYTRYKAVFDRRRAPAVADSTEAQIDLDNQKYDLTQQLRTLYGDLEQATHDSMQHRLVESDAARERAQRVALAAGLLAIFLSVVLSLVSAQRISSPLAKLIEGTRKIAGGKFESEIEILRRDEFGELAQAFNKMARRLHELDEMMKGFVMHISHELKSPLAAIQESSDLLLMQEMGTLTESQRRLVTISKEKSVVLARRINDLLDLSRIDAGVMEYQFVPSRLSEVLQPAIETATPLLREKNLTLSPAVESDTEITMDPHRITQVIENLLSNAIKFSRNDSIICLKSRQASALELQPVFQSWDGAAAKMRNAGARFLVVTVEDNGPGIPVRESKKIFERFYQTSHGKQYFQGGTGLGLAICKSIVEAHQGLIWVESEVDRGSRFSFAIPEGLATGLRKSDHVV
ncbi:MAG: ATP-binding protein [Acidobacteriia bacterium]|nr:ATP-binding protein [Terriglobia bacterium]